MKRFKNVSFIFSAALLAGFVTFSACKKDKDEDNRSVGTKAGEEICNCFTKAGDSETAMGKCWSDIATKYFSTIAKNEGEFYNDLYEALKECASYSAE